MNLMQALKMAFKALLSNKMRAILTMLGVIIGVFAVTTMVTLVDGAANEIVSEIRNQGSNLVVVSRRRIYTITAQDMKAVRELDGIAALSPYVSFGTMVSSRYAVQPEPAYAQIEGVSSDYNLIRNVELQSGRFLTAFDDEGNSQDVAVIGTKVAETLFGRQDVLGETLLIRGYRFTIIGVLEEQGTSLLGDSDSRILMPFSVAQRVGGISVTQQLYISAESEDIISSLTSNIRGYFDRAYNMTGAVSTSSMTQITQMVGQVMNLMTILLSAIAGISLVVGGIGIMNIMLVSVAERTREIGIRKAIGAKRPAILTQFLIEAVLLTFMGGLLGVGLTYGATAILENIMDIALNVTTGVVIIGLSFSVLVGVLFGMYPAVKASGLHPIDALRRD